MIEGDYGFSYNYASWRELNSSREALTHHTGVLPVSPILQEAVIPSAVSHWQALGFAGLPATCLHLHPIPKAGVQFLALYKVQHIRKSKQHLNN